MGVGGVDKTGVATDGEALRAPRDKYIIDGVNIDMRKRKMQSESRRR